jgi:hypothetical protein
MHIVLEANMETKNEPSIREWLGKLWHISTVE